MTNDAVLKIIEQAAKEEWKTLDLAGYELKELPREVSDLADLEELILGRVDVPSRRIKINNLTSLPPELENLKKLRTLNLSYNPFEEIPEVVMRLYNLESLILYPYGHRSRIRVISQTIIQLVKLKEFCLISSEIREIPKEIFRLPALTLLNLSGNKIKNISKEILYSKSLEEINITSNPINNIPVEIVEKGLDSIRVFFLTQQLSRYQDNIKDIPVEIAEKGLDSIRVFFLTQQLSRYQDNNPFKVERSIELPPEYWTAGNSILSYFSHILNVKYPNQNIKVKIEQEGLLLRMIIDTPEGQTETIEKTFNDYLMVISRQLPPENLLNSRKEIEALERKLEIAELELRWERRDSIKAIESLEMQVSRLFSLIGQSFQKDHHITVNLTQELSNQHGTGDNFGGDNVNQDKIGRDKIQRG